MLPWFLSNKSYLSYLINTNNNMYFYRYALTFSEIQIQIFNAITTLTHTSTVLLPCAPAAKI